MRRATEGKALPVILVLLAVLAGLGGFNYWRNLQAEREVFRPYRAYSERDLEQLIQAYEADLGRLNARYESARSRRTEAGGGALLGERVAAFERTRRAGERVRALGAEVSEREAALNDFHEERRLRAEERNVVRVFLRRLLTIRSSTT